MTPRKELTRTLSGVVLMMVALVAVDYVNATDAGDEACGYISSHKKLEIRGTWGAKPALHIRQNVKGNIEFKTSEDPQSTNLLMQADWKVPDRENLDGIFMNSTEVITPMGKVIVVQLDIIPKVIQPQVSGMVYGIVGACIVVVILIALAIWCIRRKTQQGELKVEEVEEEDEGYREDDTPGSQVYPPHTPVQHSPREGRVLGRRAVQHQYQVVRSQSEEISVDSPDLGEPNIEREFVRPPGESYPRSASRQRSLGQRSSSLPERDPGAPGDWLENNSGPNITMIPGVEPVLWEPLSNDDRIEEEEWCDLDLCDGIHTDDSISTRSSQREIEVEAEEIPVEPPGYDESQLKRTVPDRPAQVPIEKVVPVQQPEGGVITVFHVQSEYNGQFQESSQGKDADSDIQAIDGEKNKGKKVLSVKPYNMHKGNQDGIGEIGPKSRRKSSPNDPWLTTDGERAPRGEHSNATGYHPDEEEEEEEDLCTRDLCDGIHSSNESVCSSEKHQPLHSTPKPKIPPTLLSHKDDAHTYYLDQRDPPLISPEPIVPEYEEKLRSTVGPGFSWSANLKDSVFKSQNSDRVGLSSKFPNPVHVEKVTVLDAKLSGDRVSLTGTPKAARVPKVDQGQVTWTPVSQQRMRPMVVECTDGLCDGIHTSDEDLSESSSSVHQGSRQRAASKSSHQSSNQRSGSRSDESWPDPPDSVQSEAKIEKELDSGALDLPPPPPTPKLHRRDVGGKQLEVVGDISPSSPGSSPRSKRHITPIPVKTPTVPITAKVSSTSSPSSSSPQQSSSPKSPAGLTARPTRPERPNTLIPKGEAPHMSPRVRKAAVPNLQRDREWKPLKPRGQPAHDKFCTLELCDGTHSESDHDLDQAHGSKQGHSGQGHTGQGRAAQQPRHPNGAPPGIPKTAMLTFSVLTVLSLVYGSCRLNPEVAVTVYIPGHIVLGDVQVFFDTSNGGRVIADYWRGRNRSSIHVFDLDSAAATNRSTCLPAQVCPEFGPVHLIGCNAATQKCVCQRGYSLLQGTCQDLDECSTGIHRCGRNSRCINTQGGYRCMCGEGFYSLGGTCRACSGSCPPGFYQSSPCSDTQDRKCAVCVHCTKTGYEVRPCGRGMNRKCVSVSNPLGTPPSDGRVFVEANNTGDFSYQTPRNMFVEDLLKTHSLQSTVYATYNNQYSDFLWQRESGLKINIYVDNIQILPTFTDTSHLSDNAYMYKSPQPGEKEKFANIVTKFCRHPVPDFYNLSLEIYRSRTSAVTAVVCDSSNPDKIRCPQQFKNGETFYYRSVNKDCQRRGIALKDKLAETNSNSILCTVETPLLTKLFSKTLKDDTLETFPHWQCSPKEMTCQACLSSRACVSSGLNQSCCATDCLNTKECKFVYQPLCANKSVICSTGDTVQFTLHPMFNNISSQFMCHLRYVPPPMYLYRVRYRMHIDNFDTPFSTEQEIYNITASNIHEHNNGSNHIGFLDVSHNTKFQLKDEMMMVGDMNAAARDYQLSLHQFKDVGEFDKGKFQVFSFSDSIFTTSLTPERPFQVSSVSWNNQEGCWRNISTLHKKQKMYKKHGVTVNYTKMNTDGTYKYILSPKIYGPEISVSIPGNRSVLYHYMKHVRAGIRFDDSFKTHLELNTTTKKWNMSISGYLTGCPAYVAIIVNDLTEMVQLFNLDTLVVCPPRFNFAFQFSFGDINREKVFEVLLRDSHKNYTAYVSSVSVIKNSGVEEQTPDGASYKIYQDNPDPVESAAVEMKEDATFKNNPEEWQPIRTLCIVFGSLSLFSVLLLLLIECSRSDIIFTTGDQSLRRDLRRRLEVFRRLEHRKITSCHKLFITGYTIFRIAYSVAFTFTLFILLLTYLCQSDLEIISKIKYLSEIQTNYSCDMAADMKSQRNAELARQRGRFLDMQRACDEHVDRLFTKVQQKMLSFRDRQLRLIYQSETSIWNSTQIILENKLQAYRSEYNAKLQEYTFDAKAKVEYLTTLYNQAARDVYDNPWLDFPKPIYNTSRSASPITLSMEWTGIPEEYVNFLSFLGLDNALQIAMRLPELKKRLNALPKPPRTMNINRKPVLALCRSTAMENNTFRFVLSSKDVKESPELTVLGDGDSEKTEDSKMMDILNLLQIIFIMADIVILVYRFTRTYATARALCQGLEERLQDGKSRSFYFNLCNVYCSHNGGVTETTYVDYKEDSLVATPQGTPKDPRGEETMDSRKPMLETPTNKSHQQNNKHSHNNMKAAKSHGTKKNIFDCTSCLVETIFKIIAKVTYQNFMVKLVFGGVIALLLYCLLVTCRLYVSSQTLYYLGQYEFLEEGLQLDIDTTNSLLIKHAQHWNDFLVTAQRQQMLTRMEGLARVIGGFNQAQAALVSQFNLEYCALSGASTTCRAPLVPHYINIHLAPCHYMPIQAHLLTGFNTSTLVPRLHAQFTEVSLAVHSLSFTIVYVAMVAAGTMLVIHLLGVALFHYLKTRHVFPVQIIYEGCTPPPGVNITVNGPSNSEILEESQQPLVPRQHRVSQNASAQSSPAVDVISGSTEHKLKTKRHAESRV
ncbi:uncharacterized protein LOC106172251 isoform X2 [Lingula anatina]|uniref:Uncharacterized protein LOC106172251 isoform X2 n=1 Tax=Lingula anatina TaxID=7574 RepID=A0A2R2MLG8_LINAN|nr:uncharacterized protein LOC106172251 isoform X2 [Lingula anatina]|eukprot:XP_023930912.1 uncharacterized protein LOC106172251 isoform X2 [Lingula anatina]